MDVDTPFDWEVWRKAWGGNKQVIVGGVNDFFALPEPPGDCEWLLTRTLTGEHPTYKLALLWRELFDTGPHTCLRHGKIDKKMYGEAGVRQLAEVFKEWYARRNEPAPAGAAGDPTQREGGRAPAPKAGGTQAGSAEPGSAESGRQDPPGDGGDGTS